MVLDDPDVYHLSCIVEKAIEFSVHFFYKISF